MTKRLFRQRHPIILGFLILGSLFVLFWGGITFFVLSVSRPHGDFFGPTAAIGVVDLKGPILTAEDTIAELRDFRTDEKVKAIVLRIDSPGGAVGASQEIYQEVRRTNEVKPVVASMASIAASGGYYAALGATKIVANPGTLTGSIGVIVKFANLQELFAKIGYKSQVIQSGALKNIGAADRPMSAAERQLLQGVIDSVHQQFVRAVATQRGLAMATVAQLADGRIFSGQQALDNGLLDELGNFSRAVQLAASLAGITEEEPPLLYPEEDAMPLLRLLGGQTAEGNLRWLLSTLRPLLSYEWQPGGG